MKFNENLKLAVKKDLEQNNVVMLVGEAGIGKSSWVADLAKEMNTRCFILAVNQLADKADLTGARLVPVDDSKTDYKQMFYPHEVIMDAIKYADAHSREYPILFLDEINRTTADVTSAALSIPTMRRIGSIGLPTNLRVIVAGNDKGNITSLDSASVSRFVLYRVEPDAQTFIEVNLSQLNPHVKAVLERNPKYIFCGKLDSVVTGQTQDDDEKNEMLEIEDILSDSEGMTQFTTSRTIKAVSDWLNTFDDAEILKLATIPAFVDNVETNLFMECVVAHCGYTAFAVCLVDEIMKNINAFSVNNAAKGPQKPACYDALKTQNDVDALENYIAALNNAEKSACIIYAICEKKDNRLILQKLCESATNLETADVGVLVAQIGQETHDSENLSVATSSDTNIGKALSVFVSNC